MATFITTINYTEQGIQNIKDTAKRAVYSKLRTPSASGKTTIMACVMNHPRNWGVNTAET
ncbi:hypothetical protein Pan258_29880 [Symmachiella dynata]|uniref:hypothetical protein n=1 Tax=Symmachiella dynata TaxID=2527995 RepID=UPI00118C209B|nr:hypothetical protein [Symmachiella dynata]QDT48941.1 hypothetical protein Pan258_29880 [Symmachiella dynata]